MEVIAIYSNRSNPRIEYAIRLVCSVVLGIDYLLTNNKQELEQFGGTKINYSFENLDANVQIIPFGLLEQTDIQLQDIKVSRWQHLPIFFLTPSHTFPFDIFSAVFYLVTRYEEYLPFIPDTHGRFRADQSLAWREKFLNIPIVDFWCIELAKQLDITGICRNTHTDNYKFLLTIDIDFPWTHKNKGLIHAAGTLLKDLISLRIKNFIIRFKILTNKLPDPGDNYTYLAQVEKELTQPIHYFILCRRKPPYDMNASLGRNVFRELLQRLDNQGNVGIHPSYVSAGYAPYLVEEVKYLSDILERMVENSRQHFLRLSFPEVYRNLISSGITSDFSLGYADQTGFRAGIARSFNFYDLWEEKETGLRIVPFQVMDRTLLNYLNVTPSQAIEEYDYYTQTIKSVGGEFVCLWHNDSLSDWGEWKGWKVVFGKMLDLNKAK